MRLGYSKTQCEIKEGPSTEDIKQMINSLDENVSEISVTGGGEPTIRSDIFDIMSCLEKRFPKAKKRLLTNARMFCYADFSKKMTDLGLKSVAVPLHAGEEELFEKITQAKGSFIQTIEGIQNLLRLGVEVEIRVVVHNLNYEALPRIAKFISLNMPSVSNVVFLYFNIVGSAALNKKQLIVRYSEVVPFLEKACSVLKENELDFILYHFPKCVLSEKFRGYAEGVTTERKRLFFKEECNQCKYFSDCSGIWRSYKKFVGAEELNPL
ncbi:MAG: radical SAM protein [Candidatus Diapherotrites archaeon]|nr:radical SAM protein [Candidatus Diapherotrites archaeon]